MNAFGFIENVDKIIYITPLSYAFSKAYFPILLFLLFFSVNLFIYKKTRDLETLKRAFTQDFITSSLLFVFLSNFGTMPYIPISKDENHEIKNIISQYKELRKFDKEILYKEEYENIKNYVKFKEISENDNTIVKFPCETEWLGKNNILVDVVFKANSLYICEVKKEDVYLKKFTFYDKFNTNKNNLKVYKREKTYI